MIWVLIFGIAIAVLALLIEPYFRKTVRVQSLDDQDYLVAQLDDVARDRNAGLLSDEEAAEAEAEARRRLLTANEKAADAKDENKGFFARQVSTMIIGAAPLAAIVLYVLLGNPSSEPTPEALEIAQRSQMTAPSSANARPLAESVNELEQRLAEQPDDLDGWVMLGESYARMDRFAEAATAFGRARALAPDQAYLHAAEGESLTMANDGVVNAEATAALQRALERDATEPRARFYLALGAYQRGEREEALGALVALSNDAPPGVQWAPIVRSQIEVIAAELGRSMDELGLDEAITENRIETLEAQIASGEAPYESWIALADAYAAEGDNANVQNTLDRASERYANAPFVLQQIEAARSRLTSEGENTQTGQRGPTQEQMQAAAQMGEDDRAAMIEGMVSGLAARLENEPDDLEGWTMLARSYAVLGRMQESAEAYARAAELAPDDVNLRLGRAEALLTTLREDGEPIDQETQAAIDQVSRLNPEHPFALYFQGLAASQRGDTARAKSYWERLLATMPEGSPDAAGVRQMIDAL
ncbi:c-type cytochrome biogenesis protein CcmI [Hyphococcus flavus]|uniref:C-type cytochrome biogenesis protein CcmI n=1 Tax=Hyphococcus flavus TaxID=1866326 RepID=A0AAE9ZB70_9PROT|nr:c-type cytochrome biogenesis protein CcmI [Hyphococcus flavus]WDI31309.1 c-type cytochrome biogenesis protein CcmI [Hyphococcus flavus]